jgi:hypothetical protein
LGTAKVFGFSLSKERHGTSAIIVGRVSLNHFLGRHTIKPFVQVAASTSSFGVCRHGKRTKMFVAVAIAGIILLMISMGRWIIGPIDVAARSVRAPAKLFAVDLLGLAVLLLVAALPAVWLLQLNEKALQALIRIAAMILGAVLCTAAMAIWFASSRALSRAGVVLPLKRIVFAVVLLPCTVLCLVVVGMINLALVGWLSDKVDPRLWFNLGMLLVVNLVAVGCVFGGHVLTRWILANPVLGHKSAIPPS